MGGEGRLDMPPTTTASFSTLGQRGFFPKCQREGIDCMTKELDHPQPCLITLAKHAAPVSIVTSVSGW